MISHTVQKLRKVYKHKTISHHRRWLDWTWRRQLFVSSPWWRVWQVMVGPQTQTHGRERWERACPSCRRLWTWCPPKSPSSLPSSPSWSVLHVSLSLTLMISALCLLSHSHAECSVFVSHFLTVIFSVHCFCFPLPQNHDQCSVFVLSSFCTFLIVMVSAPCLPLSYNYDQCSVSFVFLFLTIMVSALCFCFPLPQYNGQCSMSPSFSQSRSVLCVCLPLPHNHDQCSMSLVSSSSSSSLPSVFVWSVLKESDKFYMKRFMTCRMSGWEIDWSLFSVLI